MVDINVLEALSYIAGGTGLVFFYLAVCEYIKIQGMRQEISKSQLETLSDESLREQSILKPYENIKYS